VTSAMFEIAYISGFWQIRQPLELDEIIGLDRIHEFYDDTMRHFVEDRNS